MPSITVEKERCKGCERCNEACPQGILAMSKKFNSKGYSYAVVVDPSRCIGCRMCAVSCPDVAIEVSVEGAQYEFFTY